MDYGVTIHLHIKMGRQRKIMYVAPIETRTPGHMVK